MNKLKRIVGSELFRIGSLNSISMILKIAIGVITSKVIAVFIGPSGLALVGNLRNFMSALETISTLGYQNGVIKYVAQHEKDDKELSKVLTTVFSCLLATVLILCPLLYFGAGYIADQVFGDSFQYGYMIRLLAAATPWYAASVLMTAVLNGMGRYRKVIYISIAGNIIGLLLSVVLITTYKTEGALASLVLAPALLFFVSLWFVAREATLFKLINLSAFSLPLLKKLSSYSLMAVVSAVLSPLVMLDIRNNLIESTGLEQAGYWEAITRISTYYMMFVTALLSVYFLPKLSAAVSDRESSTVIRSYYKNIIPLFFGGLLVLFLLRYPVLRLQFTAEFDEVADLFAWQMGGDLLKAASLILGYTLVARRAVAVFITTEFISMLVMYAVSFALIPDFGAKAAVIAHCATYLIYLTILGIYYRRLLIPAVT